jgi:RNA polymerase sigma factor (sigma-70 family)
LGTSAGEVTFRRFVVIDNRHLWIWVFRREGQVFLSETMIAGLVANNSESQQAFWSAAWPDVCSICTHILGSCPDANDTAVDVLTDFIFKQVHHLSNPKAAQVYLRLMSVRRSLKRRERRGELAGKDPDGIADSQTVLADENAVVTLLLPRLSECLAQLTPKAQQVLRLRFGEELTNERIGSLVGGSKQYLGRLIRRSLELLRSCLESSPTQTERRAGIAEV